MLLGRTTTWSTWAKGPAPSEHSWMLDWPGLPQEIRCLPPWRVPSMEGSTSHTGEQGEVKKSVCRSHCIRITHSFPSPPFTPPLPPSLPPSLSLSPSILLSLSPKRFIGYDSESGELEADTLRHCIYGGHVSDYMKQLQDDDEEKYKAHFSRFIKEGISADNASDHVTWSCDL